MVLNIQISDLVNPYLEITRQDGTIVNTDVLAIVNNEVEYNVPIDYFYKSGNLLVRVISDEFDSEYITFNIPSTLLSTDDIIVKISDGNFIVRKVVDNKYYDLPIATTNSLGGIIVGKNLSIDENGVLNSTGGSGSGSSIIIKRW